jgi:DNA primase
VIIIAKLAMTTTKYTIYARFEADGTVEKPDVIGAVFGQTEGLLGQDMDLRELQKTGRVGRIDVELENKEGKTSGKIIIPSSLDSSETSLLAACIETIERVGPCNAKIAIEKIEDVRMDKRKYVMDRAKQLLESMFDEGAPDTQAITEQLKETVRSAEISEYEGLPSGPNLELYDSVIVVEGRADVIVLLKNGIKNVIAIEGTSIPQAVINLSKEKIVTAFLDGDRGGDLILKELLATCEIDSVARAPRGKEVEELTKKELFKALREKMPADEVKTTIESGKSEDYKPRKVMQIEPEKMERFKSLLEDLTGTRAASLLNNDLEVLGKVPMKELYNAIKELGPTAIVLDGEIDQRLVSFALHNGVKYIVGMKSSRLKIPENITVLTPHDLT